MLALVPRTVGETKELRAEQGCDDVQYGMFDVPAGRYPFRVSLGYRRALEFDSSNTPGQDSAAVRGDAGHIVAVVVDGVGQSFYGNLAAEYLCRWLLDTLWKGRATPPSPLALEQALHGEEGRFAAVVDAKSLTHLPEYLRVALENTRKQGSQAVFAALVWDVRQQRAHLYQVGDVIVLVHRSTGIDNVVAAAAGRWSSAGKSQLQLRCSLFEDVDGFVIKTDGASATWGSMPRSDVFDEEAFKEMATERAGIDDVSVVAIFGGDRVLRTRRPARLPGQDQLPVTRPIPLSPPLQAPAPSGLVAMPSQSPSGLVGNPLAPRGRVRVFAYGFAAGVWFTCLVGAAWWVVRATRAQDLRMPSRSAGRSANHAGVVLTPGNSASPRAPQPTPGPAVELSPGRPLLSVAPKSPDRASMPRTEAAKTAGTSSRVSMTPKFEQREAFLKRVQPLPDDIQSELNANADIVLIEIEVRGVSISQIVFTPRKDALLAQVVLPINRGDGTSIHTVPGFVAESPTMVRVEAFEGSRRVGAQDVLLRRGGSSTLAVAPSR